MSYTQTPNYSLYKPTINSDNDQWGTHLNANADTIDTQLKTIANTAGVVSWNTRTGAVTLSNADVVTVLPASSTTPNMDGTAAIGTGTTWARADHVHPSDTTRAPLASPLFTGDPRSVTPPVGDADFSIATTAFVATAVAPAFNGVGRNLIHNPLFNVAQRGAGPFTANGYTADRYLLQIGGSTASVSVLALTDADRAAIGDEAAVSALQCVGTGTAGAGDYLIAAEHRLESVRRFSGKSITLSFWAKSTAATPKLGIEFEQIFGTGGSPSASVTAIGSQAFTLSTTWTRYSATIAMPSTSGKTLGTTAGTDYLMLRFWQSAGATYNAQAGTIGVQSYTLQLWGVQLEVGSLASPLEKPDPQQDLAKCQRFYQSQRILGGAYGTAGMQVYHGVLLPVVMRATPTYTVTNSSVNISAFSVGPGNTTVYITGQPTATGGYLLDANVVTLSADL